MIVAELIAHLLTLPQDYTVIFPVFSDFEELTADNIAVCPASEKRYVWHPNIPGDISFYYAPWYSPDGPQPKFVNIVSIGNC